MSQVAVSEAEPCSAYSPPKVPSRREARTRLVVGLTAVMMVVELIAGMITRSLSLTADGWHMATHVGALGLSALAYWYARTRASETRFAFGTGKVYALAGYTSSTLLMVVAGEMVVGAVNRLINPEVVDFQEALPVAIIGLVVNLVSAWLLEGTHDHGPASAHSHDHAHDHSHDHSHDHPHAPPHSTGDKSSALMERVHEDGHDHNLRAAYLHVVADALTSVLAIAALVAGRFWQVLWLDSAVALFAAAVILKWGFGLLSDCARQLIDYGPSTALRERVREALEGVGHSRVEDLHLWRVGPSQLVCVGTVSSASPAPLAAYKTAVMGVAAVDHLTIEIVERRAAGAAA